MLCLEAEEGIGVLVESRGREDGYRSGVWVSGCVGGLAGPVEVSGGVEG